MLTLAAALLCLLQEPERVTLQRTPKAGERIATSLKTTAEFPALKASSKAVIILHTEHHEVVDGRPVRTTVQVEQDTETVVREGKEEHIERPLHGRRVTMTVKDGVVAYTGADRLSANAKSNLTKADEYYAFLPKTPVAVGDSWELKDGELKSAFSDHASVAGRLTMRLTAVRDVDGQRCGVVSLKGEVRGRKPDSVLALEGELIVRVDGGIILSMQTRGDLRFTEAGRENARGQVTLDMTTTVVERPQ
jgi:hypothetical protein